MALILGEMDVTRVTPYWPGQGDSPVHLTWFEPRRPAAVTQFRAGRLEVFLLPGGRRPPGPDYTRRWGMGDDVWRAQKEG